MPDSPKTYILDDLPTNADVLNFQPCVGYTGVYIPTQHPLHIIMFGT
jgi:hypothetical protein